MKDMAGLGLLVAFVIVCAVIIGFVYWLGRTSGEDARVREVNEREEVIDGALSADPNCAWLDRLRSECK